MKISKTERKELDDLATAATEAKKELQEELVLFHNAMHRAWENVETKRDEYNGRVSDLKNKIEEVADGLSSEWDDKSERWQEGDKGEAAREWIETVRGSADDLNECEMDAPSDIEVELSDPDEVVGSFPDAPEE